VIMTRGGMIADFRSLFMSRCAGVSSTLNQDVENDAVLIDGAPEPVWLAGDRDDRQHFFDHAKAQGKPEIEPNRMADDLRRKAMALVERVAGCRHGGRIAARPRFNR
jgi:hypothetical protein